MSKEVIIRVPAGNASDKIVEAIDRAVTDQGLIVTLRGGLKSYPGCTHWHLKLDRERGTLEITWWPQHRKLWFTIQAGRSAAWIEKMAPQLKKEIQLQLGHLAQST
jgi:hypothetical protein